MEGLPRQEIWRVFFWSRLPLTVFPVASSFLLWWWGRQLFSPAGGLFSAALFSLSPLVLGHGALFKNDLAAGFGHLLFWFAAWRYWQAPGGRRAALLGVGLVLAVLAKLSMLILAPAAFLVLIGRELTWRPIRPGALAVRFLVVTLILYGGVVVAWQAKLRPIDKAEIESWRTSQSVPVWLTQFVETASRIPTPPRFWHGAMGLVQSNGEHGGVYLMGEVLAKGHPLYFLVALAVKVPVPSQVAILLGLAVFSLRVWRRQTRFLDLFWALPGFLYIGLASLSHLQLGIRLIIPALPFLFLYAGELTNLAPRWRAARVLPFALVGWLGFSAAVHYPHYISHFNLWVGGANHGLRYLSDSNIDWGQDLPQLADYVKGNNIPKIRLAYFGTDNPYAYLTDERLETIAPPWSKELVSGERFVPVPGYYAVSATLLTGQYFEPRYRDYFAVFRDSEPIGKAGYSIFIYRVP